MITTLLDKAPRFLLYALFLLMPVFWIPTISLPLDLHKQFLLAAAVLGAGILWMVDILRKREVNFRWHILFVPLGLFVLFAFISTFGSGSFLHSFWGVNAELDSFFNILLFVLLFVLIANKLTKKEYALKAIGLFVAGAVLATLFLFVSSFSSVIFPFGSAYAFSIYAGGAFLAVLLFALHIPKGTYGAYVTYTAVAILFIALLFISQWIAWAGVAVGALLITYFLSRRKGIDRNRLVAPLVILGLSLVFWFVGNPLDGVLKVTPEVRLGRQMTISIAQDTISSNIKSALFGSGPATFRNQYNLYRASVINNGPFWNLSFDRGSGAITSYFVALGVLGGGMMMIFWLWFLWFCIKFLLRLKKQENLVVYSVILMGGIYFFISWLFYTANFSLLFAGFSFVALWVALRGKQRKISFSQSSTSMFWGMAGSVAVIAALIFGGYTVLRNYSAEIAYAKGLNLVNEKSYEQAMAEFQKAARINGLDKYWRRISQSVFLRTSEIYRDESLAQEERDATVQRGISTAEAAALQAARVNPQNSRNFEQIGDFYTNIIPISDSAATMPFSFYNQAASLNPQSPHIPLKKAKAHLANAKRFAVGGTERSGLAYTNAIVEARKEAEASLALKRDFADALEFLAGLPSL